MSIRLIATLALLVPALHQARSEAVPDFAKEVEPLLIHYCYDCHGDGSDEGELTLDTYGSHGDRLADQDTWLAVWENLRAQLMPPPEEDEQPTPEELDIIHRWIAPPQSR